MKPLQVVVLLAVTAVGAYALGHTDSGSPRSYGSAPLVYTSTPENSTFRDAPAYDGPNPITEAQTPSFAAPVAPRAAQPSIKAMPAMAVQQPKDTRPAEQRRFVEAVATHTTLFANAANDMAKGATRPARARALCAALPSLQVANWVGRIETLSSNSDGLGVLGVEIAPQVVLKTWNNSFSDSADRTLLQPDSRAFQAVSGLSKGRLVRFSGTLFRGSADCFHETSMTQAGSMTNPEFVFRFSDIEPMPTP